MTPSLLLSKTATLRGTWSYLTLGGAFTTSALEAELGLQPLAPIAGCGSAPLAPSTFGGRGHGFGGGAGLPSFGPGIGVDEENEVVLHVAWARQSQMLPVLSSMKQRGICVSRLVWGEGGLNSEGVSLLSWSAPK